MKSLVPVVKGTAVGWKTCGVTPGEASVAMQQRCTATDARPVLILS